MGEGAGPAASPNGRLSPSLVNDEPAATSSSSSSSAANALVPPNAIIDSSSAWDGAICVFCGSSDGNDPKFLKAADQVGKALARNGIPLVYGGGTNGLMGAVAESTYSASGRVLGIIPRSLMAYERAPTTSISEGIARPSLVKADNGNEESERSLFVPVETMHERKQTMANYAKAGFVALPGGFGTYEEILEMVTWTQLGIHSKPVVLLNIDDFYSPLRQLVRTAIKSGFIRPQNEGFLVYVDGPSDDREEDAWDWGEEALKAVKGWKGGEKGGAYNLSWGK